MMVLTMLQEVAGPVIDWGLVGASILNVIIALVLTSVVSWGLPIIREKYPWVLPLISIIAPTAFAFLAEFLLGLFGYPVDFGPILDLLLAGGTAVAAHQVYKQHGKGKK